MGRKSGYTVWSEPSASPMVALGSAFAFVLLLCSVSVSCPNAIAQEDPPLAPPPLKLVSKAELNQLEAAKDIKDRTKLVIEFMDTRLDAAERLRLSQDHDGVFRELGAFQGLMDNGLSYLQRRDSGSGKVLDNFKRIEIALRSFTPRLETIRRELPTSHEEYLRKLLRYVRDARTKATEPLFADTVIPSRRRDND